MLRKTKPIKPVYIIGDVHGQYAKLVALLRDAGLINANWLWSGGSARLWFMGDFFDRGPDGVSTIDLVIRLQREAAETGGEVCSLLGNHEILFLGAHKFGRQQSGSIFTLGWMRNGGVLSDLDRITDEHIAWLTDLPAMAQVEERLFMHADATFYTQYGDSIEAVNQNICEILHGDDWYKWEHLLEVFSERMTFFNPYADGADHAQRILQTFGGRQIVHGHTPIHYMEPSLKPASIHEPLAYNGGMCLNMDGAMCLGGTGFVYQLPL